ncbi:MAG TPA: FAD-binding oxidoreductase, partial [Bryobacterales bacterium]|nr:FAD-binding oxidoreductase [Bryobacterales bacterium]
MESPADLDELAGLLAHCGAEKRSVELGGNFSKQSMGGAAPPADVVVSTAKLARVVQYEPRDLTISVEAGLPFRALEELLAQNNQMLPLDPPACGGATTIGGALAANCCGPRRRLYGSGRDMVIGMTFVTLEGKPVRSGGMVVKNVAGLDMAKLLIGSFGTLAAIARVNCKLYPRPPQEKTFLLSFASIDAALKARDAILR